MKSAHAIRAPRAHGRPSPILHAVLPTQQACHTTPGRAPTSTSPLSGVVGGGRATSSELLAPALGSDAEHRDADERQGAWLGDLGI